VEKGALGMLRWIYSKGPLGLISYIFFCVALSGFALGSFAKIIQEYLAVDYNYRTETLMVLGQVIFQWLFMKPSTWVERKKYAVIALTTSMIGSLLILPLLAYSSIYGVSKLISVAYFFSVVAIIFMAHHRFVKDERLPTVLSFTWVLYRLLLLAYLTIPSRVLYG
jgi:hypothetical protein